MLHLTLLAFVFTLPPLLLAVLPYLVPVLQPLLAALVLALFGLVVRAVLRYFHNAKLRHYTLAILDAGRVGALYVEQAVAPSLRDPSGLLDAAGRAAAQAAAIKAATQWLASGGALETLKGDLKLTDAELEQRLGVAVEVAVAHLPSSSAPVAPTEKLVNPAPSGERNIVSVKPSPAG